MAPFAVVAIGLQLVVLGAGGDEVRIEAVKRVRNRTGGDARAALQAVQIQVIERGGGRAQQMDLAALEEYRAFRLEAEQKGFRHFLELFDPNAPHDLTNEQVPGFINDCVARVLAGVGRRVEEL